MLIIVEDRNIAFFFQLSLDLKAARCRNIFQVHTCKAAGDQVTLIGSDGGQEITMEDLGDLSGRFNYELACDLGKRVPRRFWKDGRIVATQDYFSYTGIE